MTVQSSTLAWPDLVAKVSFAVRWRSSGHVSEWVTPRRPAIK